MTPASSFSGPRLSVIVVVVSDTIQRPYKVGILAGCLSSLRGQEGLDTLEIIVPYPASETVVDSLRSEFPEVRFFPVAELQNYSPDKPGREHHDELRACGMAAANGDVIALLEDYARPVPTWGRAMLAAHQQRWVAVGGAIENGIDRTVNWGVYYCDFGKYQNPISNGESTFASDANISYRRTFLNRIKPIWESSFREPAVNWAALASGQKICLSAEAVIYQHRVGLDLKYALQERYIWGRSFAATRMSGKSLLHRMIYIGLTPVLPFILFFRIARNVFQKQRHFRKFLQSSPVIALLVFSWSVGEFAGYLTANNTPKQSGVQQQVGHTT
jgi:hypothetical protein